jgi:hypothetical protein
MKFGICGAGAHEEQQSCKNCGTPFQIVCPWHKAFSSRAANYCGSCGTRLGHPSLRSAPALCNHIAAERLPAGERQQLTVLFADVVGSTTLAGVLDPEELRAFRRAYRPLCVASVNRFGGNIHPYPGDGVLAYLGNLIAHDSDAEPAGAADLGQR